MKSISIDPVVVEASRIGNGKARITLEKEGSEYHFTLPADMLLELAQAVQKECGCSRVYLRDYVSR